MCIKYSNSLNDYFLLVFNSRNSKFAQWFHEFQFFVVFATSRYFCLYIWLGILWVLSIYEIKVQRFNKWLFFYLFSTQRIQNSLNDFMNFNSLQYFQLVRIFCLYIWLGILWVLSIYVPTVQQFNKWLFFTCFQLKKFKIHIMISWIQILCNISTCKYFLFVHLARNSMGFVHLYV